MCGLAGIVRESSAVSPAQLQAANTVLQHRGPDDAGVWINDTATCGLSHTRLSIIDLPGGQQPLSSVDGSIHAVVNGEFYGYESIRHDFIKAGYRFMTESDSEIVIPLYLKYGLDFVQHLRGEFALILWDENTQRLVLARDRFGIKPLFYGAHQDSFYVASEVKALLAMGMPARWDPTTVADEERGNRNCQDTLFRHVKAIEPGHLMVFENGHSHSRSYWDFDYPQQSELKARRSQQSYIDEFWSLLTDAVTLRLRADVPVGVYLSGGIDSATVLALMRQQIGTDMDAFTLSFDQAAYDEGDIARDMASHAGVRHTVIDIESSDLAPNFESTIWHNESPFTNNNTIAKYILSRHVRDAGLKVVLTGEGSDEILGGYRHFQHDMRFHNSTAIGPRLGRARRMLTRRLNAFRGTDNSADPEEAAVYRLVRQKLGFVPRQLMGSEPTAATLARLRGIDLQGAIGCSPPKPYESLVKALDDAQVKGRDPLNQSLYLASKSFLPNRILTTLGDRVEMAHSIEARLPFLDHKVVEFLTRLPVDLKIRTLLRSTTEKYILKQAARPHLTDTIYRRRKHPFTAPPTVSANANPMSELIEDTIYGADLRDLDLYDQRKVIALYEQSKDTDNGMVSRVMQHIAGMAVMQRQFGLTI